MSENRVTVLNLCYIWVPPDWTQDWAVLLDTFWRVLVPLSLCQSRLSLTGLLLSSLCSLNSSTSLSKLENAGLYPPWISHNLLIQYTMLGSLLAIALSPCLLFQSLPVQAWLQNSITVISVTGLDKHSFHRTVASSTHYSDRCQLCCHRCIPQWRVMLLQCCILKSFIQFVNIYLVIKAWK